MKNIEAETAILMLHCDAYFKKEMSKRSLKKECFRFISHVDLPIHVCDFFVDIEDQEIIISAKANIIYGYPASVPKQEIFKFIKG